MPSNPPAVVGPDGEDDTRLRLSRPGRGWIIAVAVVVIIGAAVGFVATRERTPACGAGQETIAEPRNPLVPASEIAVRDDERLRALQVALGVLGAPFGEPVAGLGFNYDQLLHLYGVEDGVLAWTKHNAPVTMLDPVDLTPRWALRPATKRIAWDSAGQRFLLAELSDTDPVELSAIDTANGTRRWCQRLTTVHHDGDPISTTFLSGSGDVVAAVGDGHAITVSRLAAEDGAVQWGRAIDGIDRADYLFEFAGLLLVGGSEEYLLGQGDPATPAGPVVRALDPSSGAARWSHDVAAGTTVHVVGTNEDRAVLVERTQAGTDLVALDATGGEVWRVPTAGGAFETALRDDVVLLDATTTVVAYSATDGKELWRRPIPTDQTYFPYGFTLSQMPMLDDRHLLMPTTTALLAVDLTDGAAQEFPIPVDGVSTTYWPYQLMVTPDLIGVVTNIGGIVVRHVGTAEPPEPTASPSAAPTEPSPTPPAEEGP